MYRANLFELDDLENREYGEIVGTFSFRTMYEIIRYRFRQLDRDPRTAKFRHVAIYKDGELYCSMTHYGDMFAVTTAYTDGLVPIGREFA